MLEQRKRKHKRTQLSSLQCIWHSINDRCAFEWHLPLHITFQCTYCGNYRLETTSLHLPRTHTHRPPATAQAWCALLCNNMESSRLTTNCMRRARSLHPFSTAHNLVSLSSTSLSDCVSMNKCHCDCHADGKALEIEKPFFPISFFYSFGFSSLSSFRRVGIIQCIRERFRFCATSEVTLCRALAAVRTRCQPFNLSIKKLNESNADDHVSHLHLKRLPSVSCAFEHRHMQTNNLLRFSRILGVENGSCTPFPCAYAVYASQSTWAKSILRISVWWTLIVSTKFLLRGVWSRLFIIIVHSLWNNRNGFGRFIESLLWQMRHMMPSA